MPQPLERVDRPSWSVVCTAAEPRRLIEAFAAHHIAAGAERVFIFLDDAYDVVLPTLWAHPQVTAFACDAKYWAARPGGRPDDHRRRQTYNAEIAARRLSTSEWIASIDADEFLYPRDGRTVADLLATVPEGIDVARVLPAERMFVDDDIDGALDFGGIFKIKPRGWNTFGREFYGDELGAFFPNGFQGHVEGKSFRRARRRDLQFHIHYVRKDGAEEPHHEIDPSEGVLLHYFPASFEDWRRKFERRIFNEAYYATLPERVRAQYDIYRFALEEEGEAGVRRLFERLSVVPAARADELVAEGTAIRPDLDLDKLAAATFKPLRPTRIQEVRRNGRQPPESRIIQIGMNRSGTREICETFWARGYSYAHWDKGALARDVLAAKAAGRRPLAAYDRVNLLSDMLVNTPELCYDAGFDVAFLAEHYPQAVYLLNHRPLEEWIASRTRFQGGAHIEEQRRFFGLPDLKAVQEKWRSDWLDHLETVDRLARNGLRVLEWKINTEKPHLVFERLEAMLGPVHVGKAPRTALGAAPGTSPTGRGPGAGPGARSA